MIQDKKENDGVRIILLSATPAINTPYELALVFNLLRPGSFPKSEALFDEYYVSSTGYAKLNDAKKNNFKRRIVGLVSYYIGATPDYFATKTINYVDVEMSDYQADIYSYYEEIEDKIARKKRGGKGGSQTYKSYTRQACNFIFPAMEQGMMGETRPRPRNFKLSEKTLQNIDKGRFSMEKDKSAKYYSVQNYVEMVDKFANSFDHFLYEKNQQDKKDGYTIVDDVKKFHQTYAGNYADYVKSSDKKSSLFDTLYLCSSKMLNIVFNIMRSPGPVLVYSNYVLMEGLQIFKIYLKYFGFTGYKDRGTGVDDFRYMEYHGGIDPKQRAVNIQTFNHPDNKYGKISKIMMISPAGAEGISLYNIRQDHLMEQY